MGVDKHIIGCASHAGWRCEMGERRGSVSCCSSSRCVAPRGCKVKEGLLPTIVDLRVAVGDRHGYREAGVVAMCNDEGELFVRDGGRARDLAEQRGEINETGPWAAYSTMLRRLKRRLRQYGFVSYQRRVADVNKRLPAMFNVRLDAKA